MTTTVTLAFGLQQLQGAGEEEAIKRARLGKHTATGYLLAIACPVNADNLTQAGRDLLNAGWASSFFSGDDIADTPLIGLRKTASVEDACDTFGLSRDVAAKYRKTYGDEMCNAGIDSFFITPPIAGPESLTDAASYINRLAETPGLGDPVDVGVKPWSQMLTGRAA